MMAERWRKLECRAIERGAVSLTVGFGAADADVSDFFNLYRGLLACSSDGAVIEGGRTPGYDRECGI